MQLPFSQACENNQEPIRTVLARYLAKEAALLEIGSGTGQHGAYISAKHPDLQWYPTDRAENLEGINSWVNYMARPNFHRPVELDINHPNWRGENVDFVYSANTVHIMHWDEVVKLFAFIPDVLKTGGYFCLYGPFNYQGEFTSASNAQFNEWLQAQAPHRAIRDFESVNELAENNGLRLVDDHAMPANNRLVVWQRSL